VTGGAVEPTPSDPAIAAAADARNQSVMQGEGPVALALAAARDSRHRRAAAVAAATAAAAASLASTAALQNQSTQPVGARAHSPAQEKDSTSGVGRQAPQASAGATAADHDCSTHTSYKNLTTSAEAEHVPPASTGVHAAVADASSNAASTSSSKVLTAGCTNEAASEIAGEGRSSAATVDGIILWSHMDKDKKVHLNDFLANRYGDCVFHDAALFLVQLTHRSAY
jgi:trimeric autotransporter adhesin